jgi:hypothetical protein
MKLLKYGLVILFLSTTVSWANDSSKLVPLPLIQSQEERKEIVKRPLKTVSKPNSPIKKVRCRLFSRYRSCF